MDTRDHPGALQAWLLASRPKTLPLSVTPVAVGSALAWHQAGGLHWGIFAATLIAAMLIQIGTNLHNDAADFERGADTVGRVGPRRAAAMGWLPPTMIKRAAFLCFSVAFLLGILLVMHGGRPILALGCASLAAGWAYTGGPRPLAYTPLGELFVFVFFGLGAVLGSYWLQAGIPDYTAWLVAAAIGLPASAVLLVNNHRDRDSDSRVGKHTLAVYLGERPTRHLYTLLVLGPFPLLLAIPDGGYWIPWAALPFAAMPIHQLYTHPPGPECNAILAATARYQALLGLLITVTLAGQPW